MTPKEQSLVRGFRQWARALKNDDRETMRDIEKGWYRDAAQAPDYRWETKQERDNLIRDMRAKGIKPRVIAHRLQLDRMYVYEAIWRVKDHV